MHSYFCPECGASLDPGERCTCPGYVVKAMTAKEKAAATAITAAKRTTNGRPYDNPEKRINNVNKSIAQADKKSKSIKPKKWSNEGYKSGLDEDAEQTALIEWCEFMSGKHPELSLIYHVPNEGKRSIAYAVRMKKMGLKSGVPDLCLPVARGKWHGMYIEMKADGGKPTVEQLGWQCKLTTQGYLCIVAWSFEYARDAILAYLETKKENEDGIF